jgi:hypothetical protein
MRWKKKGWDWNKKKKEMKWEEKKEREVELKKEEEVMLSFITLTSFNSIGFEFG